VVIAYSGRYTPRRAFPEQVWVANFWESPGHYPARSRDWDYSWSFRGDSIAPLYDMIPGEMTGMIDDNWEYVQNNVTYPLWKPWSEKVKNQRWISIWISNCGLDKTGRLKMALTLDEEGVRFGSYGKCKRNEVATKSGKRRRLQQLQRRGKRRWQDLLINLRRLHTARRLSAFLRRTRAQGKPGQRDADMYHDASRFLFFFAAENSKCAHYHTEKVYHGLLAGSLPVYVGADTIDDYVPHNSIIKASSFKSAKALAAYLKEVANNETLYNSYFAWKKENLQIFSPKYVAKLRYFWLRKQKENRCQICHFFHTHGRNPNFRAKEVGCEA